MVWPPVDVAFDDVPYVLAISRRDRIELVRTEVLRPGLTPEDMARIEAREEAKGLSAIVEPLGGLAAYPSIVRVTSGGDTAVEISAHEWVHHYLACFPLGANYDASPALTAINETVADIVGRELAARIRPRLNLEPAPPSPAPRIDVAATLRNLRKEVDDLLAHGDTAGAERRMEETRQQLAAAGYPLRRLNQAYLAFHNLYADEPSSANPIGPALRRLRERSGSLAAFVRTVRDFTSPDDLSVALRAADGHAAR
jgi:hypothetical protein